VQYGEQWAGFDPRAHGTLPPEECARLLLMLRPPLGLQGTVDDAGEVCTLEMARGFLSNLNLQTDESGAIAFEALLSALIVKSFENELVKVPEEEHVSEEASEERGRLADTLGDVCGNAHDDAHGDAHDDVRPHQDATAPLAFKPPQGGELATRRVDVPASPTHVPPHGELFSRRASLPMSSTRAPPQYQQLVTRRASLPASPTLAPPHGELVARQAAVAAHVAQLRAETASEPRIQEGRREGRRFVDGGGSGSAAPDAADRKGRVARELL
jgi:hypothetical protein